MISESYCDLLKCIVEILEKNQTWTWEEKAKEYRDNDLILQHKAIIYALETDDKSDEDKPFNVRETLDWKGWADALELEMENRNLKFSRVPW